MSAVDWMHFEDDGAMCQVRGVFLTEFESVAFQRFQAVETVNVCCTSSGQPRQHH